MISHLLDRLFASRYLRPDRVVICTTKEASDDALVPVVQSAGAQVFRGDRDDIIDRFYHATRSFGFDAVIQADGDDPCTDSLYMDLAMDRLLADETLGIVVVEGLPLGLASKAIRTAALQTVWQHHLTQRNDTGFIYYFTKTGLCRKGSVLPVSPGHCHDSARLTLDYPQDLAFFRALFGELYVPGRIFGVEEIVSLLHRKPEILSLNAGLARAYWERTSQLAKLEYEVGGQKRTIEN
jgi:spore coat polysaccharide biosynthesis protein SpsF (cytidylyltransferase family)